MKRVLFFNAPPRLKQSYLRSEWAVFQENGSLRYVNLIGQCEVLDTESVSYNTSAGLVHENKIADCLIQRYPIFGRWIFRMPDLNVCKESLILRVYQIIHALELLKVTDVLFFTRSPHHISTTVWGIAAEKAGARCCFIGRNPLTGLFQPYFASGIPGEMDAAQPFSQLSSDAIEGYVNDYADRRLAGLPPRYNSVFRGWHSSYSLSVLAAVTAHTRRRIKTSVFAAQSSIPKEHALNYSYGMIDILSIMHRQSRAVAYYKMRCISAEEALISARSKVVPVVYAHLQPEATTFPDGANYHDHIRLVLALRRLGYDGTIVYQEHPASFRFFGPKTGASRTGAFRSIEYYKTLEKLGCVFVAPGAIDCIGTIRADKVLPLTITGSVALERALHGLPAIIAGKPWFKGVPNVYEIDQCGDVLDFSKLFSVDTYLAAEKARAFVKELLAGKQFQFLGVGKLGDFASNCENDVAMQEFTRFLAMNSVGVGIT